jgi:8-oxo-dGTP pyrophosphatase MutT (NUDIX family)
LRYVCGFAICGPDVALVLKNRPDFLRGQHNGIGGKIEYKLGDTSATVAMVREFKEEAGVDTTEDEWDSIGNMFIKKDIVHFFKIELDRERFDAIETQEEEDIVKVDVEDALEPSFRLEKYANLFLRTAFDKRIEMMNITLND